MLDLVCSQLIKMN